MTAETKYLIVGNKEIESLELKEGFNSITGQQLHHLLNASYLSTCMSVDLSNFIDIDLCIRSIHSNEVMLFSDELSLNTSIKEHWSDSQGYWLVLATIQDLLMRNFDFENEIMQSTALQPIGIIKKGNTLSIMFHLLVEDKFLTLLKPRDTDIKDFIHKIEAVNTFTNLSARSKIILPTLIIVRSGSSGEKESPSDR